MVKIIIVAWFTEKNTTSKTSKKLTFPEEYFLIYFILLKIKQKILETIFKIKKKTAGWFKIYEVHISLVYIYPSFQFSDSLY